MTDTDKAAIKTVITDYLEGMIYGQRAPLERAMHPKCMQAGHFQGDYEFFDRETFIRSLEDSPSETPGTPYRVEILSIEITGDVAVARLEDDCFGTTFTDVLTLIKHDGAWQIVMKAFYDHANS